jgi:hypothetical protein
MEERRKSKRVQTHLQVEWKTAASVRAATITNCSVHGCFVQDEVDELGNEPIRLTVQLPNGPAIELWGTVAFHLPTLGFGLHFSPLAKQDQSFDTWRAYVEEQRALDSVKEEPAVVTAG